MEEENTDIEVVEEEKSELSYEDYLNSLPEGVRNDFLIGGKTSSPLTDAALIASPLLIKPALLKTAIVGTGNLIKNHPWKAFDTLMTGLGAADTIENPENIALETTAMRTDLWFNRTRGLKYLASKIDDWIDNPKYSQFALGWEGNRLGNNIDGFNPANPMLSKSDDVFGSFTTDPKIYSTELGDLIGKGMDSMGMPDGVFDIQLYIDNNKELLKLMDTVGGKTLPDGTKQLRNLTKRNWMEYFLSPESLRGRFEVLRKEGKLAADLEWGDFLRERGLTTADIQAHHINPLFDSMHLFDGVKWGGEEYWDIISTLINQNARAGITQTDEITNIIRTFGKSSLEDTPHGIAHAFYRDIMKVFFNKKELLKMRNSHKYRMQKAETWAKIVNRSEEILLETHNAWRSLNPKTRMDFSELVEIMAKYDNKGLIQGIHPKYQVKDIQELVKDIEYDDFMRRLRELDLAEEAAWMQNLEKEFIMDIIMNMSKRDLKRKWGKKYNLKQSGMKQLDLFLK
tara:strand:+ start:33 stop:1568 length:1536 start_codon:yes stop_codon:yes gene_type:complete